MTWVFVDVCGGGIANDSRSHPLPRRCAGNGGNGFVTVRWIGPEAPASEEE